MAQAVKRREADRRLAAMLSHGSPFTTAGFARMVERAGVEAKLGFKAHPHMLRHACGLPRPVSSNFPIKENPVSSVT